MTMLDTRSRVSGAIAAGPTLRRGVLGAVLAAVVLAGCSSGPERDEETGELLEAGEIDVFELQVGDCLAGFDEQAEISTVRVVPCSEEHTDELFAAAAVSEVGDEYPGNDAIAEEANAKCYEEFEAFVGLPWEDSELDFGFLAPTEASWNDGDREILCTVGDSSTSVTGTLEGANR